MKEEVKAMLQAELSSYGIATRPRYRQALKEIIAYIEEVENAEIQEEKKKMEKGKKV